MKTVFLIPSYGRADKPLTIDYLQSLGYGRKDIWVGVDDEAQRALYESAVGDRCRVIDCGSVNVAQARAHLLSLADPGDRVVMLDDDVKALCKWQDAKTLQPLLTREAFDATINAAFGFAQSHNAPIWGGYPVLNAYFMSNTIDLRNILVGTIMGIVVSEDLQFDPEMAIKEDFELCLRAMSKGRNCVRYNFLVADALHFSAGGAMRYWETDEDRECTAKLCRRYPKLVAPSKSASGVKFLQPVRYSLNGGKRRRVC